MKSVHSDAYKVIIAELKRARLNAGMTQIDLAKKLKRPQSFVAKYERGERRLDLVELLIIGNALSADVAKLVSKVRRHLFG